MLKPTKHLNPDKSVLHTAARILRLLSRYRIQPYDELYDRLHKQAGDDLREVFLPALGFLFLLGKVEYYEKTDSFEFVGANRVTA
jgi:hypothetical protein